MLIYDVRENQSAVLHPKKMKNGEMYINITDLSSELYISEFVNDISRGEYTEFISISPGNTKDLKQYLSDEETISQLQQTLLKKFLTQYSSTNNKKLWRLY